MTLEYCASVPSCICRYIQHSENNPFSLEYHSCSLRYFAIPIKSFRKDVNIALNTSSALRGSAFLLISTYCFELFIIHLVKASLIFSVNSRVSNLVSFILNSVLASFHLSDNVSNSFIQEASSSSIEAGNLGVFPTIILF